MRLIPREWSELNATERDVLLGFAVHGPATAYSVWQQVNPDVDPAGVYDPLQRLQDMGYIEQVSEGEHRNEGNQNRVTDDGMRLVERVVVHTVDQISDYTVQTANCVVCNHTEQSLIEHAAAEKVKDHIHTSHIETVACPVCDHEEHDRVKSIAKQRMGKHIFETHREDLDEQKLIDIAGNLPGYQIETVACPVCNHTEKSIDRLQSNAAEKVEDHIHRSHIGSVVCPMCDHREHDQDRAIAEQRLGEHVFDAHADEYDEQKLVNFAENIPGFQPPDPA